uniref:G-protein coupled receptors family 1 profile domain-containing protein n=1 Tax=Petromyzon marinus TaxID=7757 RepID=S4R8X6_PETMA
IHSETEINYSLQANMNLTAATSATILCVQISVNIIMLHLILPFTTVLVIVLVEKQALREKPQFIFFTSLMINEVIVYLVRIIFIAVQLGNVPISSSVCNVYQSLVSVYLANDFYSLAAMSIDRCIAICWPLKYNMILSPVRVRNAVITIALVSASVPFALFLAEEILE